MKIISKIKDYYDYMQSVYGMDELVVYDRRDCKPLNTNCSWKNALVELFADTKLPWDKPKKSMPYYLTNSVIEKKNRENNQIPFQKIKTILEGQIYHCILEIGFFQYLFEVERYLDDNNDLILKHSLIETKRVDKDKRISTSPMSIVFANARCGTFLYKDDAWEYDKKAAIENPILINTWIPKIIPPSETWEHLYEYISSLNDKEIVDSRTNIEHIESNGFDKVTSFRGKV